MLVLAPAACGLAALAISNFLQYICLSIKMSSEETSQEEPQEERKKVARSPKKFDDLSSPLSFIFQSNTERALCEGNGTELLCIQMGKWNRFDLAFLFAFLLHGTTSRRHPMFCIWLRSILHG